MNGDNHDRGGTQPCAQFSGKPWSWLGRAPWRKNGGLLRAFLCAGIENNGVKVVVDAKSLVYLNGTELDYTKEGLNEGFQFNNPNVSAECGCGESFHV